MDTSQMGRYLKKHRKCANMTQLQVAEKLCISPQAVSKWERGECLPDIVFLPEIAAIFGITIEDLLTLGDKKGDTREILQTLNAFVDEDLFTKVLEEFRQSEKIQNLTIPLDFFMVLNNQQKERLLEIIFQIEGYAIVMEEIFQYLNNAQRGKAIMKIAESGDYDTLESLIPYMTKSIRTMLVEYFLQIDSLDFLEEILPFLNREQKNLIISYILRTKDYLYIFEDFLPFFDTKQRKIIEEFLQ